MSAQQLADACTEAGLPMKRSVIANFENGRRASVDLAELLVFASVLHVPPALLMFPLGREAVAEVLPGRFSDTYECVLWATGENLLEPEDEEEEDNPLDLGRSLFDCLMSLQVELPILAERRAEFESVRVQIERAKADLEMAEQAEAAALEQQRETLSRYIDKPSIDRDANLRESRQVLSAAYERVDGARRRLFDLQHSETRFRSTLELAEESERSAREIIGEMRQGGWVLPDLEEFSYLLEEGGEEAGRDRVVRRLSAEGRGKGDVA